MVKKLDAIKIYDFAESGNTGMVRSQLKDVASTWVQDRNVQLATKVMTRASMYFLRKQGS